MAEALEIVTVEEEVSSLDVVTENIDLGIEVADVHTLEVTEESENSVETESETEIITVFDENDFVVNDQRDSGSLSIVEEEKILISEEVAIEILEVSEQGPPGPPGETSELNLLLEHLEITIFSTPLPSLNLGQVPLSNSLGIYINGLIQYSSDYELNGSSLTIKPSALIHIGDILTIRYSYTIEV